MKAFLRLACLSAAAAVSMAGCGSPSKTQELVEKRFPQALVTRSPGLSYTFLVRQPDGSVLQVETDQGEIASRIQLFPAASLPCQSFFDRKGAL